ncbi:histone-lysine N-methyltransferase SETD1B-like [Antennarius striatus]|uniref:histone-lysine N-methyltransferase SETD1B-like n=1 Tax=Antennarius striatus TaxID=241820 RepID=UPI0035B2E2C0
MGLFITAQMEVPAERARCVFSLETQTKTVRRKGFRRRAKRPATPIPQPPSIPPPPRLVSVAPPPLPTPPPPQIEHLTNIRQIDSTRCTDPLGVEDGLARTQLPALVRIRLQEVDEVPFMTQHPGFQPVCLNVYTLQMAGHILRAECGPSV